MNLEIKDIITLTISSIALVLSGISLYRTHFRKPKLSISIGPDIHLFYVKESKSPGIYIPIIFTNLSPVNGFVWRVMISIKDTSGGTTYINWANEISTDAAFSAYKVIGNVKPFVVPGNSSIDKIFSFHYPINVNENKDMVLKWTEGRFDINVFIWLSKDSTQPKIVVSEHIVIDSNSAKALQTNLESGLMTTRYLYINGGLLLAKPDRENLGYKSFFKKLSKNKFKK